MKGDLSLVGPRPEREIFYDEFETYVHGFHERLKVKPGLTGLAQVNGGYDLRPEEKIVYDIEYIKKRSLWLDLKIMLKTVGVILTGGGQSNCYNEQLLSRRQRVYLVFKRFCDVFIAIVSLIFLLIPFAIISIIQKVTLPKEPVFFRQTRIGQNGKPFILTKFRSMKSSAPHDCPTKDFNEGEQYITKWGRFLRDTSIDELPQLFQVLTGKMSLIGPRPLIPQEEAVHKMRKQAGVYQLRPGMTGWAQVNGRDLVEDEEKVEFDRAYLENLGLKIDIKILCMTVKRLLQRRILRRGNQRKMQNYSVLMSVYHKEKAEYLRIAMQSMFDQTVPTNDFVLVCDGLLTDELDSVIDEMKSLHPDILNVIRLPKNGGLGNALNEGLKHCKNELVARMDSDDISYPDRCEKQLLNFENNSDLVLLGTAIKTFDDNGNGFVRPVESDFTEIKRIMRRGSAFHHPTVMFKKSVILKCGGYDPQLTRRQDYDLFSKIIHDGYIVSNINEVLLMYRADEV